MKDDGTTCTICQLPKFQLFQMNSKILPELTMLVCQTCKDAGMEPRWAIVIVGRTNVQLVAKYLDTTNGQKYPGEEIKAKELISKI